MRKDASDDDHHAFQVRMCARFGKPVLNVASHDDPARLGETFDAVNLDATDQFDSGAAVSELKNFVKGDARSLPAEWSQTFQTVVLGEYLEHCDFDVALVTLKECSRVCRDGGAVVLTFPLDDRPMLEQHGNNPEKYYFVNPGFSSWHRCVWSDEMLLRLLDGAGLKEVLRASLTYYLTRTISGLGLVARRP